MKYSKMKQLLAGVLCCGILFTQLGVVNAADMTAETATEQEVTADNQNTAGQTETQAEKKENSWRYQDGKSINEGEVTAYADRYPDAVKPGNATAVGIDVSEHNGIIDWEAVKADGIDYAIIRCGYGNNDSSQDDERWLRNVEECSRLGIPFGVYIYSYAIDVSMASSEADHVLRLISGYNLSYPVYFDMEDSSTVDADLESIAQTFCNKISAAGYNVGVYANTNWWNTYLTQTCYDKWFRWVAQYNTNCTYSKDYSMWQYSSEEYVDGIDGYVDMNYWLGEDAAESTPPAPGTFLDVHEGDWFKSCVDFAYSKSIMTGLTTTIFGPAENLNRAQFATVLHRMAGKPAANSVSSLSGVEAGQWYSEAVYWCNEKGILTGYENGEFGLTDSINREQLVAMMYRYAQEKNYDLTANNDLNSFPDKNSISPYALSAIQWAVGAGVISGEADGIINPQGNSSRAACAQIMMNFMNKFS